MSLRECQARRALLACWAFITIAYSLAAVPEAVHIYGIHSWNDGASGIMNGKSGWTVEVVNTDYFAYDLTVEQAQRILNEGFTLIIRINKTLERGMDLTPLKMTIEQAVAKGWLKIVLSISNDSFLYSEILASIITYYKMVDSAGGSLWVVQDNAKILAMLETLGLTGLINVVPSESALP